jgi:uncharacterized damage-inducible protein DinB
MDLATIRALHTYDAWANARVATALADPSAPERAKRAFGHVIAALELWWGRYAGAPLGRWEAFPALDAVTARERLERVTARWASALATLAGGDLAREIAFTDSRGVQQRDRIGDFLVHLVTHGTHHRGQVLSYLRAAGLTPPAIDYMVYYRALRTG